jgi:crossover junction endodeoxyribonuclease RuvC
MGIDPGNSGAISHLDMISGNIEVFTLSHTEADIYDFVNNHKESCFGYLEKVHSMPKQGVVSSFTFGKNFGFLIGLLTALEIPYEFVTPQTWQKNIGCLSKGNKNITKAAAQRLFPKIKITHAIADSILIAEYGRRRIFRENNVAFSCESPLQNY